MIGTEKETIRFRVQQAFGKLRQKDVLARVNFRCCLTCGSDELRQQMKDRGKRGYVFWHQQDEDCFKRTGVLYIAFSDKAVGQDLFKALEDQGLFVHWNGSQTRRLIVVGYEEVA
jgi:hypothetical protein